MKNIIAIVGKPNVGKSTLFNKLSNNRIAIVDDKPGITRDRIYNTVEWNGKQITIIDTGGIETEEKEFQKQIQVQAQIAIEEAESIVFVVDGKEGTSFDDENVAKILRQSKRKVIIAANKLENNETIDASIWELGFEVFPITAMHGTGIGDLLDKAISNLNYDKTEETPLRKLTLIGKPNSGKSSLLNLLCNENRSIVSPIAGTTRDSVNTIIKIDEVDFEIIDTAGINKKSKLIESVEHYALMRAFQSLEHAGIVLLILDASKGITHFDKRIAGYAYEYKKPIIIVINKWDLIDKNHKTVDEWNKMMEHEFQFLRWAPKVYISALYNQKINKLKEKILKVDLNIDKRIKTSLLNELILDIKTITPPQSFKGGKLNINFVQQNKSKRPAFVFSVNNSKFLHFSYERHLENELRKYIDFEGVPIRLIFKNKKNE